LRESEARHRVNESNLPFALLDQSKTQILKSSQVGEHQKKINQEN